MTSKVKRSPAEQAKANWGLIMKAAAANASAFYAWWLLNDVRVDVEYKKVTADEAARDVPLHLRVKPDLFMLDTFERDFGMMVAMPDGTARRTRHEVQS